MTDISDVQVAVGLDGRHIDGRMTSGEASPRTRINALRSRFRPAGRNVLLWSGAVGLTILLQWPWLVLYLDIRYTFGALRTGGQVGPATDIFIHRPMANRLLMSWLDHLTFGPTVLRERLTLSIAILFAGLAGAGLARSLRRWTSAMGATSVGLATFTALAWAPTVTVLQPEWTAALLSVAAISVGLARGPRWVVSWHSPLIAGAGLLLAVAALQKYTTATTVIVALGLLFVLHRRRAWMVAGWTAVLTALLFGLTLLNQHEWQWFRDMPRLSPTDRLNWQFTGPFAVEPRLAKSNPHVLACGHHPRLQAVKTPKLDHRLRARDTRPAGRCDGAKRLLSLSLRGALRAGCRPGDIRLRGVVAADGDAAVHRPRRADMDSTRRTDGASALRVACGACRVGRNQCGCCDRRFGQPCSSGRPVNIE